MIVFSFRMQTLLFHYTTKDALRHPRMFLFALPVQVW